MAIKEFTTAAIAASQVDPDDAPQPVTTKIDGRQVTFAAPNPGQLAMVVAIQGMGDSDAVADIINFFINLLDVKDQRHFRSRLFSSDDDFGPDHIMEIVAYLIEEWSARPTKQPSDYLPSQSNGGRRSTPRQHRTTS